MKLHGGASNNKLLKLAQGAQMRRIQLKTNSYEDSVAVPLICGKHTADKNGCSVTMMKR